jgi:positive regulator of sigma E activity
MIYEVHEVLISRNLLYVVPSVTMIFIQMDPQIVNAHQIFLPTLIWYVVGFYCVQDHYKIYIFKYLLHNENLLDISLVEN